MAYGARLESVLGASPRGFESPILRHRTPGPLQVPGFSLCLRVIFVVLQGKVPIVGEGCSSNDSHAFPLVMKLWGKNRGTKYEISTTVCGVVPALGSAGVPGAVGPGRPRDRHTRACGSEVSISKPARALRTLRRPPHQWRLVADVWLGASSRSPARPRRRPPAPRPGHAALAAKPRGSVVAGNRAVPCC